MFRKREQNINQDKSNLERNIVNETESEIDEKYLNLKCKLNKIKSTNIFKNNVYKTNGKKKSLIPTTNTDSIFQELNDEKKNYNKFEKNSKDFKEKTQMSTFFEHEITSLKNHIQNTNKSKKSSKKNKLNEILQRIKEANCSELNLEAHGWLMGIQEVKLSHDCKIKNIEDIELVKKHLLNFNESQVSKLN